MIKSPPEQPPQVDVIWNLTRLCGWDCSICCVDAIHVRKSADGRALLASEALQRVESVVRKGNEDAFSAAARHFQHRGSELGLEAKLRILEHLEGFDVKLDFSGGDPLVLEENWIVLSEAARRFGSSRITLTATGRGISANKVGRLAGLIGEFNFTYDFNSSRDTSSRPSGYALSNLAFAKRVKNLGIRTRAELPLTKALCSAEKLEKIYRDLSCAGIDTLLLMRLFAAGRGSTHEASTPTPANYIEAIRTLRNLEASRDGPTVKLQCALRHLDGMSVLLENPCDLLSVSFGLMPDGTLLLSPWAVGPTGLPLSPEWVVGNLAKEPLRDLLGSAHLQELRSALGANFGHCKVFAFKNTSSGTFAERLLSRSDPLYTAAEMDT